MKFKEDIPVQGINKEFHFQLFEKGTEDLFLVSYKDNDGTPHAFIMGKDDEAGWKVLPQVVPQWTEEEEQKVHHLINHHLDVHERPGGLNPWNILGT